MMNEPTETKPTAFEPGTVDAAMDRLQQAIAEVAHNIESVIARMERACRPAPEGLALRAGDHGTINANIGIAVATEPRARLVLDIEGATYQLEHQARTLADMLDRLAL